MRTFTLEYWQDEGWFVGRLKEINTVMSQGQTLASGASVGRKAAVGFFELRFEERSEHELAGERKNHHIVGAEELF